MPLIQTGFRLPKNLLKQIDRYAAAWSKSAGLSITRTDAVKRLLDIALKKGRT